MRQSVLLIDADAEFATGLAEQFALDPAFAPRTASNLTDALHLLATEPADAIVVGADAVTAEDYRDALHEAGYDAPVLTLLPKGENPSGEACLAKPVRVAHVFQTVRRLMQRTGRDETIAIGSFTLRPVAKLLIVPNAEPVRLTEKETAILLFLLRAGEAVPRETLLAEVWGYNARVTTHTLETHIYRLRQKLEADPSDARVLVTEAGGYRLVV